ncbi:MAG: alginate lyase family protein [Clostridia bacterium]|nr:alginate lyase family protein [Clostridia bacterium]
MLTITTEKFYTEILKNDIAGLKDIDKTFANEGEEAARIRFANYVRTSLPFDNYFTIPYPPEENKWHAEGEDPYVTGEKILKNILTSCEYEHNFGDKVIWDFNPTYEGNVEWTYQLNRHHEFRHIAKLYNETGDERYTRAFASLCESFIDQTKWPVRGTPEFEQGGGSTNTWRTIEVGIRMASSWPYAIFSFVRSPEVSDKLIEKIFMSVWEQAQRLIDNHTGVNWLIMEMTGLLHSGVLYSFVKDSDYWAKYALDTLTEQIQKQVFPDGFQFELTTNYHYACMENYYKAMRLCNAMGYKFPKKITNILKKMNHIFPILVKPTLHLPDINDGTNKKINQQMNDALSIDPDNEVFKYFATDGKEGHVPEYKSIGLDYSGFAVMRNGWDWDSVYMLFDGAHFGKAHQHEDKLAIILTAYGQDMIDDIGAYAYDGSQMRGYACSTYSHSTGIVDGGEQRRYGTFTWKDSDIKKKSNFRFSIKDDYEITESAYEDGYGKDFIPVVHKRRIIFFKNGIGSIKAPFFLLRDTFKANDDKSHKCEVIFNMQAMPYKFEDNKAISYLNYGARLLISSTGEGRLAIGEEFRAEVSHSPVKSLMGWKPVKTPDPHLDPNAPHSHQPSPTAVYKANGKMCTIYTILSPHSYEHPENVTLVKEGRKLYAVSNTGHKEEIVISDYTF